MKPKGSKRKSWLKPPPLEQLRLTLSPGLRGQQSWQTLKARLLQLGLERLDFNLTTRQQPDAMLEVETKLADEFPQVFHGPRASQRLQYVRQTIVRQHGEQRNRRGLSVKRSRKENVPIGDGDVLDLTVDDLDEELPHPPQPNNRTLRGNSCAVALQPRTRSRWAYSTVTSTSQARAHPEGNFGSNSSILSSVPAHRVATATQASASQASASFSSQSRIGMSGFEHIHYFLKTCSPPLGYLLHRFVDLGFRSVELLDEIARHWTRDERRELLVKLRVPQGGVVSELELITLERRFQKYYSDGM